VEGWGDYPITVGIPKGKRAWLPMQDYLIITGRKKGVI
jgi:hypothetical protein